MTPPDRLSTLGEALLSDTEIRGAVERGEQISCSECGYKFKPYAGTYGWRCPQCHKGQRTRELQLKP